jgi:hypothetical protein
VRRGCLAAGGIASLACCAVAYAGTAKVRDADEPAVAQCADIRSVSAQAKPSKSEFEVRTYGKAAARPCKGQARPEVLLDRNDNGTYDPSDCGLAYDPIAARTNLYCAGKRRGGVSVTRAGRLWTLQFKTSLMGKGVKRYRFSVQTHAGTQLDDAPDGGPQNLQPIKVG